MFSSYDDNYTACKRENGRVNVSMEDMEGVSFSNSIHQNLSVSSSSINKAGLYSHTSLSCLSMPVTPAEEWLQSTLNSTTTEEHSLGDLPSLGDLSSLGDFVSLGDLPSLGDLSFLGDFSSLGDFASLGDFSDMDIDSTECNESFALYKHHERRLEFNYQCSRYAATLHDNNNSERAFESVRLAFNDFFENLNIGSPSDMLSISHPINLETMVKYPFVSTLMSDYFVRKNWSVLKNNQYPSYHSKESHSHGIAAYEACTALDQHALKLESNIQTLVAMREEARSKLLAYLLSINNIFTRHVIKEAFRNIFPVLINWPTDKPTVNYFEFNGMHYYANSMVENESVCQIETDLQ